VSLGLVGCYPPLPACPSSPLRQTPPFRLEPPLLPEAATLQSCIRLSRRRNTYQRRDRNISA